MNPELIPEEASRVLDTCVEELVREGHLEKDSCIVLGCSTSEIVGGHIGKASAPEVGLVVAQAFISACTQRGMYPVFQCCEHLNRSLVMEKALLKELRLTQVRAIPQPKAGGSVPAAAWKMLREPVLAMHIQADAVIDVGDTLVGMHIRPVAVPLRGSYNQLGDAHLVMAYSRLPFIGGSRAVYE
ncbi:MAG: TIGR01440 family protein [Clostridia bacterium]|nr:TIGR01440 family protein [Clostridia bacterium]